MYTGIQAGDLPREHIARRIRQDRQFERAGKASQQGFAGRFVLTIELHAPPPFCQAREFLNGWRGTPRAFGFFLPGFGATPLQVQNANPPGSADGNSYRGVRQTWEGQTDHIETGVAPAVADRWMRITGHLGFRPRPFPRSSTGLPFTRLDFRSDPGGRRT